ncbi:MAG: hypothetical protein ACI9DK_002928 [Vicingaceae bacterium]|jgi:hypothetical protein
MHVFPAARLPRARLARFQPLRNPETDFFYDPIKAKITEPANDQ